MRKKHNKIAPWVFASFGLLLLLRIMVTSAFAQQDPMYSLYSQNKALINPAYVGSSNWVVSNLSYRTQMLGMTGAPVTEYFNFHTPYQKKHIGWGIRIINDQTGPIKTLTASIPLSYHMGLAGGKLSFGLEGGIINRSIDFSQLTTHDLGDPAAPKTLTAVTVPDFNAGFLFQKKNFFMGFSDFHLVQGNLDYTPKSQARLYGSQYFNIGYIFDLSSKFDLETSTLLKNTMGAPAQFDLNCYLNYEQLLGFGGTYRTGDGIYFLVKYNITQNIRIAYSYDYALSPLKTIGGGGSHEILISYRIKLLPPPEEKEIHPRYYF